jgi:hypothetical protein
MTTPNSPTSASAEERLIYMDVVAPRLVEQFQRAAQATGELATALTVKVYDLNSSDETFDFALAIAAYDRRQHKEGFTGFTGNVWRVRSVYRIQRDIIEGAIDSGNLGLKITSTSDVNVGPFWQSFRKISATEDVK